PRPGLGGHSGRVVGQAAGVVGRPGLEESCGAGAGCRHGRPGTVVNPPGASAVERTAPSDEFRTPFAMVPAWALALCPTKVSANRPRKLRWPDWPRWTGTAGLTWSPVASPLEATSP